MKRRDLLKAAAAAPVVGVPKKLTGQVAFSMTVAEWAASRRYKDGTPLVPIIIEELGPDEGPVPFQPDEV